jgi:hypothetical protein
VTGIIRRSLYFLPDFLNEVPQAYSPDDNDYHLEYYQLLEYLRNYRQDNQQQKNYYQEKDYIDQNTFSRHPILRYCHSSIDGALRGCQSAERRRNPYRPADGI